jgi:hypothetical protein
MSVGQLDLSFLRHEALPHSCSQPVPKIDILGSSTMRALASVPPEPHVAAREKRQPITLSSFVTVVLLLGILFTGPLILGGARHWVQLPLLEVSAFLMLIQALRVGMRADPVVRVDLIDLAVVAFTLYAIARWLTSPTEYFSRLEILNVIGYATIFLTCRYGLVRRSHGLLLLQLLVLLGIFELLFGYYLTSWPRRAGRALTPARISMARFFTWRWERRWPGAPSPGCRGRFASCSFMSPR